MRLYTVYFSPTGGTRRLCEALAFRFGKPCTAVDLTLCSPADLPLGSEDVCIVGAPAFGGRIPALAVSRLKVLQGNGAAAVAAVSFGNRAVDDALLETADLLTACGFRVIAGVAGVTQHSTINDFGKGRPDREDLAVLHRYSALLAKAAQSGEILKEGDLPGHRPYKVYGGSSLKPVGDDTCLRCGLCARQCPVGAIPPESPHTVMRDMCISCMRCVSVCPAGARHLTEEELEHHRNKLAPLCAGRKENRLYLPGRKVK